MKPALKLVYRSEFIKHMLFRLFNILHNSLTIVSRNLSSKYSYSNCNYFISFCSDCRGSEVNAWDINFEKRHASGDLLDRSMALNSLFPQAFYHPPAAVD
jgi:hypothetical protein